MSAFTGRARNAVRLPLVIPMLLAALSGNAAEWRHGLSYFGDLKYPADFDHFEYVNPEAPKGGELRMAQLGNFDSLNAFIRKGRKAAGFSYYTDLMIYDRLMFQADDEPSSYYGWLAESVKLADDYSWVRFRLRDDAFWHDGEPVTVHDVLFTFEQIKAHGSPQLVLEFSQVSEARIVDDREILFTIEDETSPKTAQRLAIMPVAPEHYWRDRRFGETTLEIPLGSGPYRVTDMDPGRSITFELVPDYWGRDIPVNKGRHNIRRVSYDYFTDFHVIIEAAKAGDLDALLETQAKRWATQYDFPGYREGLYIKNLLVTERPLGMALAHIYNLRLERFQDRRVREALTLAYDFEWLNRILMYDFYLRTGSYFSNSNLAARGLPSDLELALLEPFRDQVPEAVFTREFTLPKTEGRGYPRANLLKAARLLGSAGWALNEDDALVHRHTGERFTIEFVTSSSALERTLQPYIANLRQLGIEATVRLMEVSQYIHRVGKFDFEATIRSWPQTPVPGPELRNYWGSDAAGQRYSRNDAGIEDPVVDALIEAILSARTYPELQAGTRALDRVLLWNYYVVPGFYAPGYRYGHWDKYERPAIQATYRTGFFDTWWYDEEKARRVDKFLNVETTSP